jgi:acyl-CoA thioesterase YciA
VQVEVFAERFSAQGQYVKVTEASLTYVAIDMEGKPRAIPKDGLSGLGVLGG